MPPARRRLARLDLALLALAGAGVALALGLSLRASVGTAGPPERPRAPRVTDPHALGLAQGRAGRAGVDPLAPPGLPPGARIDPETGWISGLEVPVMPGEEAVPWSALLPANGARSAEDLPAALRALDGRHVVLVGFVMPLYDPYAMRSFLFLGNHFTCCFGEPPGLGEVIVVHLAPGEGPLDPTVRPVVVRGRLVLEPMRERGGDLLSLLEIHDARARPYDGG